MTKNFKAYFEHIQLTESQSIVVNQIERFLASRESCFILKGYAGTGKTLLLEQFSHYLADVKLPFFFAAPTGRATKIIRKRTKQEATTIHRLIYNMDIKQSNLDIEGEDEYKLIFKLRNNELPYNAIFIVDESSMISDTYNETENLLFGSGKLLSDFLSFVNVEHTNRKLIFIGDNAQLPPVNSRISPALSPDYLQETFALKVRDVEMVDVFRQKHGSGILNQSIKLRESIQTNDYQSIDISSNNTDMIEVTIEKTIQQFCSAWKSGDEENGIIIAYTNKNVYHYNQSIREQLGFDKDVLQEGERLLVTKNTAVAHMMLFNGDFIKVERINPIPEIRYVRLRKVKDPIRLVFRNVFISVVDLLGNKQKLVCNLLENLLFSPDRTLDKLEFRALIADFNNRHPKISPKSDQYKLLLLKDPYVNALHVKFAYAITCHKSQGGEWQNIWVDFNFTKSIYCQEYFRWAYTAITRTKQQLYMINPPHSSKIIYYTQLAPYLSDVKTVVTTYLSKYGWELLGTAHNAYQDIFTINTSSGTKRLSIYYRLNGKITSIQILEGTDTQEDFLVAELGGALVGQNIIEGIKKLDSTPHNIASSFKLDNHKLLDRVKTDAVKYLAENLSFCLNSLDKLNHAFKISGHVKGQDLRINIYFNKHREFTKIYIEKGNDLLTKEQLAELNRICKGI